MFKVIIVGGLIVSLASLLKHGGFLNQRPSTSTRPSTRYGPPGSGYSGSNESSTEPYFRIILSSNNTYKGPTSTGTSITQGNKTGSQTAVKFEYINLTTTTEKPSLLETSSLPTIASKSRSEDVGFEAHSTVQDLHFNRTNSIASTTTLYENTKTPTQGPGTVISAGTLLTKVTESPELIVESTSSEPPKVTDSKPSTTFLYETGTRRTAPLTSTRSSILVESTNAVLPIKFATSERTPIPNYPRYSSAITVESTSSEPPQVSYEQATTFSYENGMSPLTSTASSILVESTIGEYPNEFSVSEITGIESTSSEIPRVTNPNRFSSAFANEELTSPFISTTSSSILVESTKERFPSQSSSILVESTSEYLFKASTSRPFSTLIFDKKTTHLISTKSSILAEYTNRDDSAKITTYRPSLLTPDLLRQAMPSKRIVETVADADYTLESSETEQNRLPSRPLNHFIPPTTLATTVQLNTSNNDTVSLDRNISIPPAYYLPPRIQPFPSEIKLLMLQKDQTKL